MYIDGDTHYWPVNFLERVNHPGRGNIEFKKGAGAMIRYGETFPAMPRLIIAMAKKYIPSAKPAGISICIMKSWCARASTIKWSSPTTGR